MTMYLSLCAGRWLSLLLSPLGLSGCDWQLDWPTERPSSSHQEEPEGTRVGVRRRNDTEVRKPRKKSNLVNQWWHKIYNSWVKLVFMCSSEMEYTRMEIISFVGMKGSGIKTNSCISILLVNQNMSDLRLLVSLNLMHQHHRKVTKKF